MALLITIDTATDNALVCLSHDDVLLAYDSNTAPRAHASFIYSGIQKILAGANKQLKDVDAFAVTNGPGSYTGLRVGLSAAKGFCYALSKPLITLNTLEVIALAAIEDIKGAHLVCPMLDARRMEVFTALYDDSLNLKIAPHNIILDENFLIGELNHNKIIFCGNGSHKFKIILNHSNALFLNIEPNATHFIALASKEYNNRSFKNVIYSQPAYLKNFFITN